MMNIKNYLIVGLLFLTSLLQGQVRPVGDNTNSSSCSSCTDSANDITNLTDNQFRARPAQAYYWEVCQGSATIIGSNTSRTIQVSCSSGTSSRIKLTRFVNGNCVESCEIFTCDGGNGGNGGDCVIPGGIMNNYEPCATAHVTACPISGAVTHKWFVNQDFHTNANWMNLDGNFVAEPGFLDSGLNNYHDLLNTNVTIKLIGYNSSGQYVNERSITFYAECPDGGPGNPVGGVANSENSIIYPNPYKRGESLHIDSKGQVSDLELLHFNGVSIKKYSQVFNNTIIINENLKTGVYFLRYTIEGTSVLKRILIK